MGGPTSTTQVNRLSSGQTTPYGPASTGINNVLMNAGGIAPGPSDTETNALNQLVQIGQGGNQFAPAIGKTANYLLGGGDANQYAPIANQGFQQYETGLAPFLDPKYLDPNSNPYLKPVLDTLTSDISNNIRSQYAGAGRPFSGYENQTIARGLSQGLAPALLGQYNTNVNTQLGALASRYGGTQDLTKTLTGLNQQDIANRTAGAGLADVANQANMFGPNTVLAAEAARRGIPLQTLAAQMGILLPAGQAFGPQFGDINQTQTNATPFNPWSLAGLAFMPLGGTSGVGSSLLGRAGASLFG